MTKLEEEAKSLVGDGRGRRVLSSAVEAWRLAVRAADEHAVTPQAWKAADVAHKAAEDALAEIRQRAAALATEANRLQRIRRVGPLIAELDSARAQAAALGAAPALPVDAGVLRLGALQARREAERDLAREIGERTRLVESLASLTRDPAILAAQDSIDALDARRAVAMQAEHDLPAVRAEILGHRAKLTDALADLDGALGPEQAAEAVPPAMVRGTVQSLISRHAALAATAESAAQSLLAARRRRDHVEAKLREMPVPAEPALLRRTLDAVRAEGPLEAERAQAELTLGEAAAAVQNKLSALPLWGGDIDALAACRLPLSSEIDAAASRLEAASRAVDQASEIAAQSAAEIAELEEQESRLAQGQAVPTPHAVGQARALRDRAWRLVRRAYETGAPADAVERTGLPVGGLAEGFEILRDDADRLADRRADEAQRVADFLATTGRLDYIRRRTETDRSAAEARVAMHAAAAAWRALWAPADVVPASPVAMTEWRRLRDEALRLGETVAQGRARCADLGLRRDRARASLAALLGDVPEGEPLAGMLLRGETQCQSLEAAAAARRELARALTQEEARLPELQAASDAALARLAAWRNEWAEAGKAVGLPRNAGVDAAESALAAWARIAEIVPGWRVADQRVVEMEGTAKAFGEDIRAMAALLGEADLDLPASAMAARLVRRLAEARRSAALAASLSERIAGHERASGEAALRLRDANSQLETLLRVAQVADDAALERAIEQALRRAATLRETARLERALFGQGDGLAESALRDEAGAVDADAAAARLAEIHDEEVNLGERREQSSAARTRAEAALATMQAGGAAAAYAQEAEDALAEARHAAERYARLHVARVLLRAGIERFRAQRQDPLLHAAGAHFALLTGGRYVRLATEQPEAGRTLLVAIRDDGGECAVDALSEGTRDQLYLALRVAAVESHAAVAEPLPFIADDLLVHFDDTRAAAALALLARLGRTTQVILFTHHDHIAVLAARIQEIAVQHLPSPTKPLSLLPAALDA